MTKWKEIICSENGMKIVNGLFFLSLLIRNSVFIFCAYGLWLLFLAYSIRNTPSKGAKAVYALLSVYAVVMIGVNLYFLIAR